MRITQSMMTRNYLNSLNSAMRNVSRSNQKINSGRKYEHLSENVSAGAKALNAEEQIYKNEQYVSTIEDASIELDSAYSNMMSVTDIMLKINEKATKAMNSATLSPGDRQSIAGEIKSLQDQVLKTVNVKFGDKYLFGDSNNATPPFSIDTSGNVLFNGVNVDDITKDPTDGKYYYPDPITGDPTVVYETEEKYIDIGLGVKYDNASNIDPTTAFDLSFSGLDILGFGKDANGYSNNALKILGELANAVAPEANGDPFDPDKLGKLADLSKNRRDTVLSSVTELGSRSNFLENTANRIEDDILNLKSLRAKLIETDPAEEITQQKMFEFSWNAILKMGSKIIPPSLMDFIS